MNLEGRKEEFILQSPESYGKLIIKDGWVLCPVCGKGKLQKLLPDTTAYHLPRKCKICGHETILNIEAPAPVS